MAPIMKGADRKKAEGREGVHVALLRGINVGGRNRLPMAVLAGFFRDAGCAGVRTYIQSGNVVFGASAALAGRITGLVAGRIADTLGLDVPVVTRPAAELRRIVKANPFGDRGVDPRPLHVVFLADVPSRARVARLDPDRSPPDVFVVRGRDIYLHCPNGMGKTRLTNAYFDSVLETTSTVRNWRTVLALADMVSEFSGRM